MTNEKLDEVGLVSLVDRLIESAAQHGLDEAVFILKMARLDIVARLNGITVHELKAFGAALAKRLEPQTATSRPIREQYGEARTRSKARRTRSARISQRS